MYNGCMECSLNSIGTNRTADILGDMELAERTRKMCCPQATCFWNFRSRAMSNAGLPSAQLARGAFSKLCLPFVARRFDPSLAGLQIERRRTCISKNGDGSRCT